MMQRPCIVLVGGFLGAGKTTLILAAARELKERGMKPAIILNDQGDTLVDTRLARQSGLDAGEVTGGCFCCQFDSLVEAIHEVQAQSPDVIFAEPVGSCTDIAATVVGPLRESYSGEFRLAPLTVCVDPARACELETPGAKPALEFLYRNQLAEADLVCYTKSDLYETRAAGPDARYVSAVTGQGVAAWLDEVLFGHIAPGEHVLEIDYAEYARAEAELAWLNLRATMECEPAISPAMLVGPLLDRIAGSLDIVHLKAMDQTATGFLKAAMCNREDEPQIEGTLDASPATAHELLVNLRSCGEPAVVQSVVEECMADLKGRILFQQVACFTPAPPKRPGSGKAT